MADAGFVKVAQVSEISPGEMITVDFPSGDAVLIANVEGVIHACDDICSHAYASLSEGDINGAEVECPLHGAVFNITTGEALTPPAEAPIKVYQVQVEGDDILVAPPQG
ncbi:MAG: non-heme iron oxygenase ferredoxin subunit [Chloroflexi bacterium]|nr:non-heme iron oxygenase ferredoxin subunit [Chloroflexota bacterium]